jgi:hypothetical protein
MKSSSRRGAGKPDRKIAERAEMSLSTTPVPSSPSLPASPGSGTPSSGAMSEAVSRAVTEFMKTTFGTQDQELQDRFLSQVANIVPDATVGQEQTCNHVAAALRGIAPRDSLEGMFGVQMVAVHTLAMEMMRRAAFNGQTDLGIDVFVNRSTKLLRIFTELTEALSRYRGKFEQKMTVEHVHVYQGGQAIVGQVSQNNNQVNQRKDDDEQE